MSTLILSGDDALGHVLRVAAAEDSRGKRVSLIKDIWTARSMISRQGDDKVDVVIIADDVPPKGIASLVEFCKKQGCGVVICSDSMSVDKVEKLGAHALLPKLESEGIHPRMTSDDPYVKKVGAALNEARKAVREAGPAVPRR